MKQIKAVIIKTEHHKTSKLQNDATVSKSVTTKWIKVNDYQVDNILLTKTLGLKL